MGLLHGKMPFSEKQSLKASRSHVAYSLMIDCTNLTSWKHFPPQLLPLLNPEPLGPAPCCLGDWYDILLFLYNYIFTHTLAPVLQYNYNLTPGLQRTMVELHPLLPSLVPHTCPFSYVLHPMGYAGLSIPPQIWASCS